MLVLMKLKNKNTKSHFRASRHHEKHHNRMLSSLCAVTLIFTAHPLPVQAAPTYDAQIDATQHEVITYQKQQVRLKSYAASVTAALTQLKAQLADVNDQIAVNEQKYTDLTNQLLVRETDVKNKSDELGAILRQAYFDGQISPIEIIASSRSVSDYMDYFEARDRLQSQTLKHLEIVKAAKREVLAQQREIAAVLRDGKAMRDTLEQKRTEQQDILSRTRGQQSAYARLISERNKNIKDLRAEQLGANRSFFSTGQIIEGDPNRGGYPDKWANAPQDSLVDNWGMYNRECVSYTAWKVHQSGRRMPYWGGRGNANEWSLSAEADGIKTGSTPKKGAVAIAFIGPYGHSMYVEKVLKDGRIHISEFNYYVDGTYTERIISADGLTYVYFET